VLGWGISGSSGIVHITLQTNKKLDHPGKGRSVEAVVSLGPRPTISSGPNGLSFLRIPPFPGARIEQFAEMKSSAASASRVAEEVRRLQVGGTFWGAQPKLPSDFVLVRDADSIESVAQAFPADHLVLWTRGEAPLPGVTADAMVSGECDPWHMLAGASALVTDADDELRLIAGLLDVPCHLHDRVTGALALDEIDAVELLDGLLSGLSLENPFSGEPMEAIDALRLCGFWRKLIDSNRDIAGGLGFAFWKQDHVAPLLWGGSESVRFLRGTADLKPGKSIAVWRTKAGRDAIEELESNGTPLIEVEDGFLRSRGLGADCIPPLSITVDRLGAYFDPSQPSELEILLEKGDFDSEVVARARKLRQLVVEAGIGKYEQGRDLLERPAGDRRHILVPGQVEDDRAVQLGGCGLVSNLELLKKVRGQAPEAYILYKPHPDVLAGHRRGAVPDKACLQFADEIVGNASIGSLIEMVDEVHVNTSLAGFEALLRGKIVTTFGVPFYAGWGLTKDFGPVPFRRTAKRTLDELVAAVLLLYPRYLDPVTGLPCPAEVVVARLSVNEGRDPSLLVGMRRLQGKLMRRLRSLVQ